MLAKRIEVKPREKIHTGAGTIAIPACGSGEPASHVVAKRHDESDSPLHVRTVSNDDVPPYLRVKRSCGRRLLRRESQPAGTEKDYCCKRERSQDEARLARALARDSASV